jgi:hypothetical protein
MSKNWIARLAEVKESKYSQEQQDGIVDHVFNNISNVNSTPFAVGFGCGSNTILGNLSNTILGTQGSGSNTANLVLHKGWNALLLDRYHEN